MKKLLLSALAIIATTVVFAQTQQHESFKKDKELQEALLKFDLREFMDAPVNFVFDTLERQVTSAELTKLMKTYISTPKNTAFRKASETNNGYVQSFGLYTKDDDVLYYVRFTLNPLTSKLEEVVVEKNN